MDRRATIDVLNRLLQILYRSLPRYVHNSRLWVEHGSHEAWEILDRIATDHEAQAARVAAAIDRLRGPVDTGQFPHHFTALNDLAARYIARQAVEYQERDLEAIRQCVDQLSDDPQLRALGEEIYWSAQEHLDALKRVVGDQTPAAAK